MHEPCIANNEGCQRCTEAVWRPRVSRCCRVRQRLRKSESKNERSGRFTLVGMGDIPRPLTTVHLSERAAHAPHNLGESRILEISENAQANADVCPGLASALGADQAYDEIDELMPMYAQTVFADVCATSARKLLEQVPFAAFLTPRGARLDARLSVKPVK